MKGKFSLYEMRIFLKIVEHANILIRGQRATKLSGKTWIKDGRNVNLTVPIIEILSENSHDYKKVRTALDSLMSKKVEFYNPEKKVWFYTPVIYNAEMADGSAKITFSVAAWLINYILDFTYKNFTQYDITAAFSLPSPYAVRLYWITCHMQHPLSYSVDMLREMLGVGDKYPSTKDFIRRCIDPSQKILEVRHLNGFTYTKVVKANRITAITFSPVVRQEPSDEESAANLHTRSMWIPQQLYMFLTTAAEFEKTELAKHKPLWINFVKVDNWPVKIADIVKRSHKAENPKGFIINAVKGEVATAKAGSSGTGR